MPDYRLNRSQMREVDRISIEEYGIPGIVLMENAGRSVSEWIVRNEVTPGSASHRARCAIFCGPGNNGGDGFVVARWLAENDFEVECFCTASLSCARGDAKTMREIAARIGVSMHDVSDESGVQRARERLLAPPRYEGLSASRPAIVVDALLGTGSTGAPRSEIARAIALVGELSASGAQVVAIDVPSGLDCDTGRVAGLAVRADTTVTFECEKVGFADSAALAYLGRIVIATVGAPRDAIDRARGAK